jgi:hypothetical protein
MCRTTGSLPLLILLIAFTVVGCTFRTGEKKADGTAWAAGSFSSNGQRIYFTGTSAQGTPITYRGGPEMGMMMGGRLACVSCHGTDARGGEHTMHMEVMDAPDIRWFVLAGHHHHEEEGNVESEQEHHHDEYSFEDIKNAVEYGKHPDGEKLRSAMPRWKMGDADLRDLMVYLKSYPKEKERE